MYAASITMNMVYMVYGVLPSVRRDVVTNYRLLTTIGSAVFTHPSSLCITFEYN